MKTYTRGLVESKSNKMHLDIKNDLELDINNASISRRNRKSKKTSSSPIKRIRVSNNLNRTRMMGANATKLAKKRVSALKSKPQI